MTNELYVKVSDFEDIIEKLINNLSHKYLKHEQLRMIIDRLPRYVINGVYAKPHKEMEINSFEGHLPDYDIVRCEQFISENGEHITIEAGPRAFNVLYPKTNYMHIEDNYTDINFEQAYLWAVFNFGKLERLKD